MNIPQKMEDYRTSYYGQLDYSIALQQAIEYHCHGREVPPGIAKMCPHHAKMLNKHWSESKNGGQDG